MNNDKSLDGDDDDNVGPRVSAPNNVCNKPRFEQPAIDILTPAYAINTSSEFRNVTVMYHTR